MLPQNSHNNRNPKIHLETKDEFDARVKVLWESEQLIMASWSHGTYAIWSNGPKGFVQIEARGMVHVDKKTLDRISERIE